MPRRLDDNDLIEAGGVAGISRDSAPQLSARFTRSSAHEEQTNQSTFPTTKDDREDK